MRIKLWKKSSIDSPVQTSIHTSIHSPRSSFQDQRSSVQTSQRSSAKTHLSSLRDQRTSSQHPLYSIQDFRPSLEKHQNPVQQSPPSIQVSHSTIHPPNTPTQYSRHPLSPPAPTPYDYTGWGKANTLLSKCSATAQELDIKATLAEIRWLKAEQATPPSSRSQLSIPTKILLLREINDILVQTQAFLEKEARWRKLWKPSSPYFKYPAWDSCYAEYMDVYEGEGVAPMLALELLEKRLKRLLGRIGEL
jgi:hypothetical protein